MMRVFPYSRTYPAINLFTATALASGALLLFDLLGATVDVWTGVFGVLLFVMVFVVYGTPLFTAHAVTDEELRIRYGLIFKADIRLGDIEQARPLAPDERLRKALDVTTDHTKRIAVHLREPRRFAYALFRSSRAIVISVQDIDGFLRAVSGHTQ